MLYETRFLLALVTTCAIEVPVLFVLLRYLFREKSIPIPRTLFAGILCTALTLPYLWFVLPPYVDAAYYPVIGEILVILVEATLLCQVLAMNLKKSFACSVVMNIISFTLGWFLL